MILFINDMPDMVTLTSTFEIRIPRYGDAFESTTPGVIACLEQ